MRRDAAARERRDAANREDGGNHQLGWELAYRGLLNNVYG